MKAELPEADCSSGGPKRPAVLKSQLFSATKAKARWLSAKCQVLPLRCAHSPCLPNALIDSYVLLGRRVPRKILVHAVAHERLPRVLIAESLQRLPDGQQQRFPAILRKFEACPFAGPGIPRLNGVVQAGTAG
jgi:hypothetical protein